MATIDPTGVEHCIRKVGLGFNPKPERIEANFEVMRLFQK